MPPSEASAPGSIGKNTPWSRRCSFSALRVTPGWITQSRSSGCTSSTRFMSRRSMQTPPEGALTCPSSEVPVPNAITGTPNRAQIRTTSWMSAVSCAITTASGGCGASQVVVWACWSRTACEVISRLPNRAASASSVLVSAFGSGRPGFFGLFVVVTAKRYPPDMDDRGKGYITGQGTLIDQTGMADDQCCRRRGFAVPIRVVPVVGNADRAGLDRLQRPSQHGLLQCDVRPRDRPIMAAARNRARLYEGAPELDLHGRV